MVTVAIKDDKFNAAMDSLREAMVGQGQDVSTLLVDEHRRLTRTIVNFTAPMPAAGARQRGELAVKKDLYSLISEASPELIDTIGSKYGLTNIDTFVGSKAGGGKTHLLWDNLDPSGNRLEEYHHQYLTRDGHVPRQARVNGTWQARVVVEKGKRDQYVQLVQSHVGKWKAKWALAAAELGDRYPNWIARHFGARGGISRIQLHTVNQSISFGGRGPNFRKSLPQIKSALAFRTKAIVRRIKLVISGYRKDIAQGMKARAHAHEHNSEAYEEVD